MIVIDNLKTLFFVLLFSSARITAALIIAPFFSNQIITGTVRNIVIISLTMIVVPITMGTMPAGVVSLSNLFIIIGKEAFIGLVMGIIGGLVFFIADGAGSIIDTQRGSSMGQLFDPSLGEQSTTLGSLFTKIILYIFFVGGGFLAFLGILYNSYKIWPIFSFFPNVQNPLFPKFVLELTDELMRKAVLVAAPIGIVMFLVEFGLGMMNRFAQQLNVFSLAMPIKSGVAMFMIILYIRTIFDLFKIEIINGQQLMHVLQSIFS